MLGIRDSEHFDVEVEVSGSLENTAARRITMLYGTALCGVLLVGALLRLTGIGFGLPNLYHWDEKIYFRNAFYTLATGGDTESLVAGNIPYFLVPVLLIMSAIMGLSPSSDGASQLVFRYLQDPTPFYLIGRGLWVGFGLTAVWLTYLIGRDVFSRRAGSIAAAFLATAYLVVSEGHYIKGDTTAMLGLVLTAWGAIRLVDRPALKWYLFVGAAIGLSVACKFYTYTLVVTPLLAHLMAWPSWQLRVKRVWLLLPAAGAAALAFAAVLPAVVIDPSGVWEILQAEGAVQMASLPTGETPVWLSYWTEHLWNGIGWPLELCGLAGLAWWVVLGLRGDAKRLVLFVFPLLMMLGILTRPNHFARYALPLVPFVALAAADLLNHAALFVQGIRSRFSRLLMVRTSSITLWLVVGLICTPSILNDIRFAAYASSPDTRTQAARWIETHLPAGSSIVGDGSQGFEGTSSLGVPVRADPLVEGKTWSVLGPHIFWREPLLQWLQTYTPTYKLTFATTILKRGEVTSTHYWNDPDVFVMLSWRGDPEKSIPASPFWEELRRDYGLAARFDCNPCFPQDPYAWAVDYQTLTQVNPMASDTVAGPVVWVYRRRPLP